MQRKYIKIVSGGATFLVVGAVIHPTKDDEAVLPEHPETHHERHEPRNAYGRYAAFSEVSSSTSAPAYSSTFYFKKK